MAEQDYFKNALSNFTFEAASGGAIRHLADLGFTVKEIRERLSYPTPYERVQKTVWEHMLDREILLLEEPGGGRRRKRVTYVKDYDAYGRASFRQVVLQEEAAEIVAWKEVCFREEAHGGLAEFLDSKCRENGEESAYVSCDFGIYPVENKEKFSKMLRTLEEQQRDYRDYIEGLPWEKRRVYHRLDQRMREITACLYKSGWYHGYCYFGTIQEKIRF